MKSLRDFKQTLGEKWLYLRRNLSYRAEETGSHGKCKAGWKKKRVRYESARMSLQVVKGQTLKKPRTWREETELV